MEEATRSLGTQPPLSADGFSSLSSPRPSQRDSRSTRRLENGLFFLGFISDDIGKQRRTQRQPTLTLKLTTEPDDSYSMLLKLENQPLDSEAGEWTVLPQIHL
jgi:hypothetical protein